VPGRTANPLGFAYLLKQHCATAAHKCPGLLKKRVSPHVLRHTCAMIVLQATQDIRKVSLWLGHANLATTEVYTRGDPTEKLEAIEAIVPPTCAKASSGRRTNLSPCSGVPRNGEWSWRTLKAQ